MELSLQKESMKMENVNIERTKSETDFETLEKLAKPLHEWLQDNYCPHASIVIDFGLVRVVEDRCGMPLPVRD